MPLVNKFDFVSYDPDSWLIAIAVFVCAGIKLM